MVRLEEARRVFREERRGYWAAALPVVLEKHGLTSFEESTVAGLEEALRRDEVGAVLVARTAARAETTGVLHRLRRLGIPLLIEGPLPCELHELAGIVSAEPTAAEGAVAITSQLASAAAEYGYPAGARITVPGGATGRTRVRDRLAASRRAHPGRSGGSVAPRRLGRRALGRRCGRRSPGDLDRS